MAPSDEALVAAITQGDKGAFDLFLTRHLPPINAYAYRLTGSRADADDVSQDVFLKVWQKAATYRKGKVKVTTWLHTIAHNAVVDLLRRRRPQVPVEESTLTASDPPPDSERLHKLLGALPLNQRTAVALCLLGEHSTREAAHILGMTPRAVESLISRARRSLKEAMHHE